MHAFILHVGIFSYMIPFEMECLCVEATFLTVSPTSHYLELVSKTSLGKENICVKKESLNVQSISCALSLGTRSNRQ